MCITPHSRDGRGAVWRQAALVNNRTVSCIRWGIPQSTTLQARRGTDAGQVSEERGLGTTSSLQEAQVLVLDGADCKDLSRVHSRAHDPQAHLVRVRLRVRLRLRVASGLGLGLGIGSGLG